MALREQSHDEYENGRQERQAREDMDDLPDSRQHHRFRNQPQTWDEFWDIGVPKAEREKQQAALRGGLLLDARSAKGGWAGWRSGAARAIAARELEEEGILICNYRISNKVPVFRVRFNPVYRDGVAT